MKRQNPEALRTTPIIGVTSSPYGGRYMWWFYWLSLKLLGERPLRLLPADGAPHIDTLDGLIVGGGDDISVDLYDGIPVPDSRIDPARDKLELALLESAFKRGIPVLGVCRGSQMLNVVYGGSLHENIYETYDDLKRRWTPLPVKDIEVVPGSRLHEVMGRRRVRVNSLHTQSVDRLGSGLDIVARDERGVVQAIEDAAEPFRIGVQWHPEFIIYKASQRRIFSRFVDAVDERFAAARA